MPDPPVRYAESMERVPALRASDFDREQVAERLRHATAEGRLSADELEDRLGTLYAARTYGELDALLADLPVSSPDRVRVRVPRWAGATGVGILLLAVLGTFAGAGRHSPDGAGLTGPIAESHHLMIAAASMVAVFAVLAICATVLWLMMRLRETSDS
jgi:hypothetical protein